ncbi:hypothetical protein [Pseudoalteromonas piscicida]
MKLNLLIMLPIISLSACVVMPVQDTAHTNKCEISSDRKTLKIVDVADETNTYYSVSGIILTPILVPTTAIISGTYVLANNAYRLGEETIKCESKS